MPATTTAMNRQPGCGTIEATRHLLRDRATSVTGHVQTVLTAIQERDRHIGAFASVAGQGVLREAAAADRLIGDLGPAAWQAQPLLGITVSVKDLIQTRDLPTRRGSLLKNRRPRVDAPAVARLRRAGAIVVGKTTTSEYGWSASTVSPLAAPTRNPWGPGRTAGGSSGGAAAALAAGLCTAALGTDGAGSIRIPAAFCGVVGFKPSFGRVPYVPACPDRLAHLGPLARSVADIAELTAVIEGAHPDDPDSGTGPPYPVRPADALRVGWLEFSGTTAEVRRVSERARSVLTGRGHRVECLDVPFPDPYPALVDIIATAEAAAADPADDVWSDPGRAAIVRYGRTVSAAAVRRAEQMRRSLCATMRSVMSRYDLLAMAAVPIEPFDVDGIAPPWAANPADLRWLAWSPASYPFNMTGQPAVSLPVGVTAAGFPVGLQLVGPLGGDDVVLTTAGQIEADIRFPPVPQATD